MNYLGVSLKIKLSNLLDCQDDIPQVAKWYFDEWDANRPDATLAEVVEKVSATTDRFAFVAHINETLVGAGEIKFREYVQYPNFHCWVDGIYVPIDQRGKGISTELINFAKSKASEQGAVALYLRCEPHLVALYQRYGFNVVEKEGEKSIMACVLN